MKLKKIYKVGSELVLFALLVFIDQITKYLAVLYLKPRTAIPLIDEVLELRYLENTGAAFGILQNKKTIFLIATAIIIVIIIFVKNKINSLLSDPELEPSLKKKYFYLNIILVVLISGAIGNLIDRLRLDYVIDFIYFRLINFPVFNIADSYVSISAVLLMFMFLFVFKEKDYTRLFPNKNS